jgi:signal transduction histidine kinase
MLKDTPIQQKLMMVILLTCGAVLLMTCTSFVAYEVYTFRQTTLQHLSTLGQIVAANSTAAIAFQSQEDAEEILSALKAEKHVELAILYDNDGNVFAVYPFDTIGNIPRIADIPNGYQFTTNHLEGYQPVVEGTQRLGTLYIKFNLQAMEQRFRLYFMIVVLVFALSLSFAYILSKVLQRNISEPILSLAQTARAISGRQDYSVRATRQGNDELGLLTDAFNHMLARIQEQTLSLNEFNKNLEKKVVERTRQLEQVNEEQNKTQKQLYESNKELAQALEELQSTQEQLLALNEGLEQRVKERTSKLMARENELVEKNKELHKINIDLDNFIYTASHDLKSPISNIEGLSYLLSKKLAGRLSEEEQRLMGLINAAVLKFKDTIKALTEITKAQKDIESAEETLSIADILQDVKEDIKGLIEESRASITESLDVMSLVYGKSNLRSILYNLISNAIKYRSAERPIRVEISSYIENRFVVISVKDNGLGIRKEDIPKVFKMFKRLHAHVEGSGIGMYIIKRMVENKGGKIELESEIDKGSTFRVYLTEV